MISYDRSDGDASSSPSGRRARAMATLASRAAASLKASCKSSRIFSSIESNVPHRAGGANPSYTVRYRATGTAADSFAVDESLTRTFLFEDRGREHRMDRVREALARHRGELLDRWNRQLRAAAEAGFPLDSGTAEVLPRLLEAADRALQRRFRPILPGTPSPDADARRAALQCGLLGGFVFDAALEKVPGMSAAEQRLLADALAQAAVETLVQAALQREWDRRRRDTARLARLAHELRNSVTAARLALDLLRRRGAVLDSRPGRLLETSLSRLRDGIEDTLLDEVLSAGGFRTPH